MKTVDEFRIIPIKQIQMELFNSSTIVKYGKKIVSKNTKICKVLSGGAEIGTKDIVNTYDEEGKEIVSSTVENFSPPLIFRYSDETKDDFRLTPAIIELNNITSYKLVVEVVEVLETYKDDKKVEEHIHSELLIGV